MILIKPQGMDVTPYARLKLGIRVPGLHPYVNQYAGMGELSSLKLVMTGQQIIVSPKLHIVRLLAMYQLQGICVPQEV